MGNVYYLNVIRSKLPPQSRPIRDVTFAFHTHFRPARLCLPRPVCITSRQSSNHDAGREIQYQLRRADCTGKLDLDGGRRSSSRSPSGAAPVSPRRYSFYPVVFLGCRDASWFAAVEQRASRPSTMPRLSPVLLFCPCECEQDCFLPIYRPT